MNSRISEIELGIEFEMDTFPAVDFPAYCANLDVAKRKREEIRRMLEKENKKPMEEEIKRRLQDEVRKCQPLDWRESDSRPIPDRSPLIDALLTDIAEKMETKMEEGEIEKDPQLIEELKAYTASRSALDWLYGIDGWIEYRGVIITLDATVNPLKIETGYKADFIISPEHRDSEELRKTLAEDIVQKILSRRKEQERERAEIEARERRRKRLSLRRA